MFLADVTEEYDLLSIQDEFCGTGSVVRIHIQESIQSLFFSCTHEENENGTHDLYHHLRDRDTLRRSLGRVLYPEIEKRGIIQESMTREERAYMPVLSYSYQSDIYLADFVRIVRFGVSETEIRQENMVWF